MIEWRPLVADLASRVRRGYGPELPSDADRTFIQLADTYFGAAPESRSAIRASVPNDSRLLLIGFSDRMAILADRLSDPDFLERALAAHLIEDFRYDPRENLFRLALVHHVAGKLRQDPNQLWEHAAANASASGAEQLREFLARPAELKSLAAMRIVEKQTPDGVDYEYQA